MNFFVNTILWIAYVVSLYFSVFLFLIYMDKKEFFKTEKSSLNPKGKPIVTVIIPAYNEERTVLKTMRSAYNLEYPKEKLEIIVINDGSKDNTQQIIEDYIKDKPNFRLISQKNMGKATSMNKAIKIAKGEFFACLDADSFVDPKTLLKMLSLYYEKDNQNLAIITPAMKVHKPKNLLQKVQWLEYLVIILISRLSSHLDSLYVAPGPFSLYKTSIIKEIGGFDETSIVEDQEIAYRVQKKDYQITQCFDGYVYTTAPKNLMPFYRQRRRWYLGSIICVKKYKNMIANRKYGDFGMMQMVKNVVGYILAITGITVAIYLVILPLLRRIKSMFLVKFDLVPYLLSLKFQPKLINFLLTDFKMGFLVIFIFAVGFFLFYKAHQNANEKIIKWGFIPLIPYFAFYYLLKGIILLLSLLEFTRGRKLKW